MTSNSNEFWQSFRARASHRTPDMSGSPPAIRTSPLSLLYKDSTWEHYSKLNLTFSSPSRRRGVSELHHWSEVVTHQTLTNRSHTWWAGHPTRSPLTLGIKYYVHQPSLTCWQSGNCNGTNTWPASQGGGAVQPHFGSVGLGHCATSSPRVLLSTTMPYFGHIEDIHGFWSIWCFSVIRCS
jgi:hypothetical protein